MSATSARNAVTVQAPVFEVFLLDCVIKVRFQEVSYLIRRVSFNTTEAGCQSTLGMQVRRRYGDDEPRSMGLRVEV